MNGIQHGSPVSHAGPDESRAWTVGKGWTAPQDGGVVEFRFIVQLSSTPVY